MDGYPSLPSYAHWLLDAAAAALLGKRLYDWIRLYLERKKPAAEVAFKGAQTQKAVADSATELIASALDYAKSLREETREAKAESAEFHARLGTQAEIIRGQGRALEEANARAEKAENEVKRLTEE